MYCLERDDDDDDDLDDYDEDATTEDGEVDMSMSEWIASQVIARLCAYVCYGRCVCCVRCV